MEEFDDYYGLLGLSIEATVEEIQQAAREKARRWRQLEGSPDAKQRRAAEEGQEKLCAQTGFAPVLAQCKTVDRQADDARYWVAATNPPLPQPSSTYSGCLRTKLSRHFPFNSFGSSIKKSHAASSGLAHGFLLILIFFTPYIDTDLPIAI